MLLNVGVKRMIIGGSPWNFKLFVGSARFEFCWYFVVIWGIGWILSLLWLIWSTQSLNYVFARLSLRLILLICSTKSKSSLFNLAFRFLFFTWKHDVFLVLLPRVTIIIILNVRFLLFCWLNFLCWRTRGWLYLSKPIQRAWIYWEWRSTLLLEYCLTKIAWNLLQLCKLGPLVWKRSTISLLIIIFEVLLGQRFSKFTQFLLLSSSGGRSHRTTDFWLILSK